MSKRADTQLILSLPKNYYNKLRLHTTTKMFLCYTLVNVRGVCSVGRSSCDLFLVVSLSCGSTYSINLLLVTNHPRMVRIAEGRNVTINPPT